jgi:hypothetical protein
MVGIGMDVDYVAEQAAQYREAVVYPAASRRALLERELRKRDGRRAHTVRPLLVRTGDVLVRLGERLRAAATPKATAHS